MRLEGDVYQILNGLGGDNKYHYATVDDSFETETDIDNFCNGLKQLLLDVLKSEKEFNKEEMV